MDCGFRRWEGCFSCPIFRNQRTTLGWQVQPSFTVVPAASSRSVLEGLASYFGCGKVYSNTRHDNHREDLSRYQVSRLHDLRDIVVPFFWENALRTSKKDNFEKFARIIEMMDNRVHCTMEGSAEIAGISQTMNRCKPSEVLRILRDHTPTTSLPTGR
jgi:LAGLIDADG endonuclease